ncbi:tRNA (pseudouridine(54)-N(1))-methyltransferase TrmY [Salinibaculum rarum]|uniref:tRNA (pseudouridine(54)-N(1))-methyltransferase TrmY n=1 Tax=Salinibaculum rarum TaxID=3058903 RepID=UPI00265D7801|nr:tRNA (pseudouridine(54)-N(1))-methyltransferase TrmY [Salinibaculum sp. KK48]
MRQFLVVGHDAPTTADFSLNDLPGAGRLDALCRCVTSALLLSHDIRGDVRVYLVLSNQFTVTFDGSELQGLNPDERSTAALVRTALDEREEAIGHIPVETSPGVSLVRKGFEATLDDAEADGTVVQLHGEGTPAIETEPPTDPVFVLSDHRNFTDEETALLDDVADKRVSLGPRRLHGNQAVTVAHNWLDTDGFSQY